MFCKYCGTQVSDQASFCHKCGKKIDKIVATNQTDVLNNPINQQNVNSRQDNSTGVSKDRNSEIDVKKDTRYSAPESKNLDEEKKPVEKEPEKFGSNKSILIIFIIIAILIITVTIILFVIRNKIRMEGNNSTNNEITQIDEPKEPESVYSFSEEDIEKWKEKNVPDNNWNETEPMTEENIITESESYEIPDESQVEETVENKEEVPTEAETQPEKKTGWVKNGGAYYYYDDAGKKVTGWLNLGGQKYYLGNNGIMATGWTKISGSYYYFTENGEMRTGWLQDESSWYYLNNDGKMASNGWKTIAGDKYYFGSDGVLWVNTVTPDGSYVDEKGRYFSNTSAGIKGTFKYTDDEEYYEDRETGEITYHYTVTLKLNKNGTYDLKVYNGKDKTTSSGTYYYDEEESIIEFSSPINAVADYDEDFINLYLDDVGDIWLERT